MASPTEPRADPWWPELVLALVWALGPALPTIIEGQLLGQPHTDLYPSVWGLWAFAEAQPDLPASTALLGHPSGMGYAYSSPLKGWLAWPLLKVLSLPLTWNLLVLGARLATVLTAWLAARAWGFTGPGALAAAAVYGCAPFFHGYAVEGIVEGTDGWTLALLVWALGRRKPVAIALTFGLTLISSWYLGMVACLIVSLCALRHASALAALAGFALAVPFLLTFTSAFAGTAPLDDAVRAAMGAPITLPRPGLTEGLNPFALTAYVGWVVGAAALWSRSRYLALAALPAVLSLGMGPIYELPVAELVRFPYRWHAGTLVLLAAAVAMTAQSWRAWWLAPLVVVEGLLLSPIEPIIPGAPAEIPAAWTDLPGPTLVLPGPVAMPPGEVNRSRGRARQLLYFQTAHGQPIPWIPDFNAVGVLDDDSWLDPWRAYDPLERRKGHTHEGLVQADLDSLEARGIVAIYALPDELGGQSERLVGDLAALGLQPTTSTDGLHTWVLRN